MGMTPNDDTSLRMRVALMGWDPNAVHCINCKYLANLTYDIRQCTRHGDNWDQARGKENFHCNLWEPK